MENKEIKKTIPAELDDGALDNVSGGTCGDSETCPVCGTQIKEGIVELTGATLEDMQVETNAKPKSPIEIANGAIDLLNTDQTKRHETELLR